jgi:DNA adenine methylase
MKTSSPLRYPGGKSAMSELILQIRRLNAFGGLQLAEPFAGGAGASLDLLFREETNHIHINDADPAIFDFWWSLLNQGENFAALLETKEVTLEEWHRQRRVYRSKKRISRLHRGFSSFFLNRCNRSGIIVDGGPIGGTKQRGGWRIDARFNKSELKRRCERVTEYRDRISVSCRDGIDQIESLSQSDVMFFVDPPYFAKGGLLYLNALDHKYHSKLSEFLNSIVGKPWVLTYDDCPEVRRLYRGWATIRPFSLRYSAANRKLGKEILVVPRWIRLPTHQNSNAIEW